MKAFDLIPALIQYMVQEETIGGNPSGTPVRVRQRLEDILHHANSYYFSAADRLVPWVAPEQASLDPGLRSTTVTSVFTPILTSDRQVRQAKLCGAMTELIKANKRVLLIAPDNRTLDEALVACAKALRGAGLQYRSFLCRYEPTASAVEGGINLRELSFDAQIAAFVGKAQSDKAGLRRKLARYLELAPVLYYKAEKQKDLDEVRNLEWRLLTALGDVQASIKRLETIADTYDALPIWHRVGMQVVGTNIESMKENCALYEEQKQEYLKELEIAQARISELKPEAYVAPEMRPEYNELKDEITRLGGVERVREVIATEEDKTRLPFLQAKRMIAATAPTVAGETIFATLRYDALLVNEAPRIPLPLLLICACMTRERIVLAGDPQELPEPKPMLDSGWLLGWPASLAADNLFPAGTAHH